jgi:type II secretory pathway component PulF
VLPAVGWAALVLWLMMRLLRGPRAGRVGRWLRERVMWYTPGLHGLARARGLSDVCFAIEAGLRSGLPLHSAVREAGAVAMSGPLAQRVARWADELEAGREVSEAARRSGLPAMLVGIVSTSRGDLREGLRFLSAYYGSRFSRSVMLVQAAVLPVGTLVVGLVVAGVGMAVFEPLVQWMEAVSDAGGFMP